MEQKKEEPENYLFIFCPHCSQGIIIYKNELNCRIFRHGVYKKNNTQLNPHLDKKNCDELVKLNKIYGCGKPFKLTYKDNNFVVEKCGYI